jgi:uncharacterized protein YjbI with pentapeptide repeats
MKPSSLSPATIGRGAHGNTLQEMNAKPLELRQRWKTPEGVQRAAEVFARLQAGKSLDSLASATTDGRIGLRGLVLGPVRIRRRRNIGRYFVEEVEQKPQLTNVEVRDIDFTGAILQHLRFDGCTVGHCSFELADCRGFGTWNSTFVDCSFAGANLRDSAFGGVDRSENRFESIDFSKAHMRGLASSAAVYERCSFDHAELKRVDFQASQLIDCRFAGELREVIFSRVTAPGVPRRTRTNSIVNVDFSKANLRWCEFRGVDVRNAIFPRDENHLVIENVGCVLRRCLAALEDVESFEAHAARTLLSGYLKWLDTDNTYGMINRLDICEAAKGESDRVLKSLDAARHACASDALE